jgi:hypothetical protein
MTEAERTALATATAEAERLRTDPAFQAAVLATNKRFRDELKAAEAAVINALLNGQPANIETVRTKQAQIAAIDTLCQEIANAIIRGTPQRKLSVA